MKNIRTLMLAVAVATTLVSTGCAVVRGQETAGAYIDDTAITTAIKAKLIEDKAVDAAAVSVETLNGSVSLSGFAKSSVEKAQAEYIASNTKGVRWVHNNLIVRP